MIKKFIHDYFSFTRGERFAVVFLSLSLVVIGFLPKLVGRRQEKLNSREIEAFSQELSKVKAADQPQEDGFVKQKAAESGRGGYDKKSSAVGMGKLFRFNPNTISGRDWQLLGLSDKTVQTIEHYREKGGKFTKPDDLRKIYGLKAELAERLMPFVDIPNPDKPPPEFNHSVRTYGAWVSSGTKPRRTGTLTDISVADSLALVDLPGIGPRLAARIINFRQKLGGFYSVEQLAETYGLPDSVFQALKSGLKASGVSIKKIRLNSATLGDLGTHPYIRWNIAKAIIAYRDEHGPFAAVDDLSKLDLITSAWLDKIRPYLEL